MPTPRVKSILALHMSFMETAPPQIITVEKSPRASKFETILEESMNLVEDYCMFGTATNVFRHGDEVAPAPVITVKKQSYKSTLDTIWEETVHYAEHLVSEAADAIFRPALRLNYWESLSMQFCITSDIAQDLSPAAEALKAATH